jgi:pimeloyl-ACP methyl ester carboxylesterase
MDVSPFGLKYLDFILKPAAIIFLLMAIIKLARDIRSKPQLTEREDRDTSRLFIPFIPIILGGVGLAGMILTERMPRSPVLSAKFIFTQLSTCGILLFCLLVSYNIIFSRTARTILYKVETFFLAHLAVLVGAYLLVFLFIFIFQDEFILRNNFLFQPTSISSEQASAYRKGNIEEITFTNPNSIQLHGWFTKNTAREKSPLILFFGGSHREVSYMIDYAARIEGWSVALVNYRGYGLSEGVPSEEGILNDAVFLYDAFSMRSDIDPEKIVAMGWSLGANVAAILSADRQLAGTILVAPSDSESHWFQRTQFPYLPLWVMRSQYFDAAGRASSIQSPLLCFIGGKDESNPPDLGRNLVENWKGEKTLIEYEAEDHQILFHENNSWDEIRKFLD